MIAVFFFYDILIHVVGGIAHDLPDAVGFDFKFYRVGRIVEIAFRALQFLNEIAAPAEVFRVFS